jgi:hypothetical protein
MNCFRFFIATGLVFTPLAAAQPPVTLHHVHGLAYSSDGQRLMVPSHHGIAVYSGGKWTKAPGPEHDYMGFAATRSRLYSSGHPAPGSKLVNPFGLIRSGDGGKTWEKLGLEGESDFHLLAASWNTNAVYVWNTERNSRMPSTGLYFTLNEGFTWQRAAARGLAGESRAVAAHPGDARIVSVATSIGIFLSRNAGETFEPLVRGTEGLGVFFDLDAEHVWYSTHDGQARLSRMALKGDAPWVVALPPMRKDAVAYISQNPVNTTEYAIATFERNVFISKDSGGTWVQVADRGRGK